MPSYWIKFKSASARGSGGEGIYGVTALDRDDALRLLASSIFARGPLPEVEEIFEDVDLSECDGFLFCSEAYVPFRRHIWHPHGYDRGMQ